MKNQKAAPPIRRTPAARSQGVGERRVGIAEAGAGVLSIWMSDGSIIVP
jgi:hypothetical protein